LSRQLVVLALASGIAPSVWADEGDRAIATAFHLLLRQQHADRPGPQMSG